MLVSLACSLPDLHKLAPHRVAASSPQAKAARQAGPLPEIQAGAGEAVADGVTLQKVVQPNKKAMEPGSAVNISQAGGELGASQAWSPKG